MIRCCRGNWATVSVNDVFSIFFAKSGRAAQFFENAKCSINSLFAGFTMQFAQMFMRHGPASGHAFRRANFAA